MANTLAYFVSPSATMKKMINSDSSLARGRRQLRGPLRSTATRFRCYKTHRRLSKQI